MARAPYIPVPTVQPSGPIGRGMPYQHIEASPAAFGAGEGAALQRAGGQIEQVGNEFSTAALQRQRYQNNIGVDQAMNQFQDMVQTHEFGDPNNPSDPGYYGLKGQDAINARGPTEQAIIQGRQQIEDNLPNNYMKNAFNTASRRLTQFTMSNIGRHYDTQLDTYNVATQTASINLALQGASASWNNDDGYNNLVADATRAQALRDRASGASPEVAQWNQANLQAKFLTARVEGALPYDAGRASQLLQQAQGKIPAAEFARLSSEVQTKTNTLAATHGANNFITNMDALWGNTPQNEAPVQGGPPQAAPHPNNIGNVRASNDTFAAPNTPTDGVTLAANTLRKGYQGMTLQQIGQKWVGRNQPPQEIANWVSNVSRASGVPADAVPDLDNPVQLAALVKGIGVAEKSPQDRASFTDQIIRDGVSASLTPRQMPAEGVLPGALHLDPSIAPQVPAGAPRPFAPGEFVQNPDGGWSSEISVTVQDPRDASKWMVVPSLWLVNGKPTRVSEDQAADYAVQSGLPFRSFGSEGDAEKYSEQREDVWEKVGPQGARSVPPLWSNAPLPNVAQPQQAQTFQTRADYYQQNAGRINDALTAYAQAQAPDNPMVQDKIIRDVQSHIRTTIQAQDQQVAADGNTVERWLNGDMTQGQKPTAIDQMPQQVQDAYQRWEARKPVEARGIDNVLKANAKTDTGYGAGFYPLLTQTYAHQITDPTSLFTYVGDAGGLTSAGLARLTQEMHAAATPQGAAEAQMKAQFFNMARQQITSSDPASGIYDPKGDARFDKFLAQALPAYDQMKGKYSTDEILNPSSAHYIGNIVKNFMPSDSERLSEQIHTNAAANLTPEQYASNFIDRSSPQAMGKSLAARIAAGQMTWDQAATALQTQFPGQVRAPAPQVPLAR